MDRDARKDPVSDRYCLIELYLAIMVRLCIQDVMNVEIYAIDGK
jgi:hypothetical protein